MEGEPGSHLGQHITLRRPRIHRGAGQLERSKRRCCRPYSPSHVASRALVDSQQWPSTPLPAVCTRLRPSPSSSSSHRPFITTSPLERRAGRVLSITLQDCRSRSEEAATAETLSRTFGWKGSCHNSRNNVGSSPSNGRLSPLLETPTQLLRPGSKADTPPVTLRESPHRSRSGAAQPWTPLESPEQPSEAPGSPLPPPCSRWELSPILSTVRSKLEGFAEIFLSPLRSHLPWRGGSTAAAAPSEAKPPPPSPAPPPPPSPPPPRKEGRPATRLCRSLSCPEIPASPSPSCWPHHPILPAPSLPPSANPRHRRHTLGGADPSRELTAPPALLCLRKEVFPSSWGTAGAGNGGGRPERRVLAPAHPANREQTEATDVWRGPVLEYSPAYPGQSSDRELPSQSKSSPARASETQEQVSVQKPGSTPRKRKLDAVLPEPREAETPEHSTETSEINGQTRVGKVSRFRIRKAPVKTQLNLTPMGLPKPARLNKKEFSLEEIYTNKNYKAPTEKRPFETIFEEPVERNGLLVLTSQRRLKRTVQFQDGSLPRKRRLRQKLRLVQGGGPGLRGDRSRLEAPELERLLRQRLSELDSFFAGEEG
ncbi:proline-rich protein 14-like [Mobula birostris]|uniref:proline-rich protein 14-like n=1 Tax=Mobula birostris TaxID=1983395 RepID=UPI003B28CE7A